MPRPTIRTRVAALTAAAVTAAATALTVVPPAPAVAATTFAGNDHCLGQCADILPPGENGNATLAAILAHQVLGTRPAHSSDQLDEYANLVYGYAGLTDEQIARFYHDASFGVPDAQVESTVRPRADVTIVRDSATGVPHVTGTTRSGTMFGAGYAGAQDRLWVMDLLRHAGRGRLSSFAGGAPGNRELEQSIWANSPYTEADLQAQVDALRQKGTRGQQLHTDVGDYIAGVNTYIDQCVANANCPGEYNLTGNGAPQHFTMTDLIATAGVIGGLFGGGGGAEMQSALVRVAARAKFGPTAGDQVWQAFRQQNDPETVLTLHDGQSFPYGGAPAGAPGVVLPDAGTVTAEPLAYQPTASAGTATATSPRSATTEGLLSGLGALRSHGMSNAVVISGRHTVSGNPIAVFGPQTGYFAPQLLMLQELQGPGISARGASFAGLSLYVLLGRGQDYAWSATSAAQDITDTYAVPLCTTDGSAPTLQSNRYLYHGQCLAMEVLEHTNSWSPTLADSTPAGSYTLRALRTRYGLVAYRGMVNGQPTAFTRLRSTYRHEADSAIGFQAYNDPAAMGSAAAFQDAAANIGYAFNWFYVNSTEAAYFNSGSNPVRPSGADPNLPTRAEAGYEWQGWNPDTNTATYTPAGAHPRSVNQDYYVSWNNKQAYDYSAADGNFSFGSVHRAQLLDGPVRAAIAGQQLDRAAVVRIMADAAVTDLRGQQVLGDLLRAVTSQPVTDPTLADAVAKLRAWQQSGFRRAETTAGSRVYQHADAIRIFDAWWPLLAAAEFKPGLGADLYGALVDAIEVNEAPSGGQSGGRDGTAVWAAAGQPHKGSSFQYGWWGYVDKDIRTVLGDPVTGGLGRTYCGNGNLGACRQALLDTLAQAAALPSTTVYPGDSSCAAGDQWCADAIAQSGLGGISHPLIAWQNRPTYQQVVSFPARRGDDVTNLAQGRAATASSTQFLTSHTPDKAVDGSLGTRWSSSYADNQWIRVDLGSGRTVNRVILRWEAAYGSAYRVEVSTDGATWRTAFSTTTGNGGVDNVTFAPVTARYVRVYGVKRATSYGFSLHEFEVYAR
ncbi:penicillin acylase family protein [Micromonospora sp. 4G57]|uniref:Penicillin acylase family protein n=1 Tax=Micromonospora sicca TaxID=2202420 RepID=A0ABU5J621_9ACTN|nr:MULTISPECIES: penicillin acylase family protein [unclassified Micromonospora]MDZ5444871.1 penicillin acylase family protein [Micromonospora sp. 4G57]MDZ5487969.1 penicillin acylase family protein [Micromonospora sp. 4G53]